MLCVFEQDVELNAREIC